MTSRFVSAGGAEVKAPEGLSKTTDEAWDKAKKQVEEARKTHSSTAVAHGTQEGGVSLYEHLQAQKLAKQEAFEEASKLRNQFRPLDEAEVEFLESIKCKELTAAASVRKETAEQLDSFRRQQAEAEKLARGDVENVGGSADSADGMNKSTGWSTSKKRRRIAEDIEPTQAKSAKSVAHDDGVPGTIVNEPDTDQKPKDSTTQARSNTGKVQKAPGALSLVAYDSESDSDD